MALFKYPHVKDIWVSYLKHFVDRWAQVTYSVKAIVLYKSL